MYLASYEPITIVNCTGTGSAPADLTSSYTKGTVVATEGIGMCTVRLSFVKDGATTAYVRLMDYADSSKPRALQWTRMDTGVTQNEHTFTVSTDVDLQFNLGGTVPRLAIEKKAAGVLTVTDAITGALVMSEKF